MTYEHLCYEQRGPVTLITIDRPERMNAVGPRTHAELVDAWTHFRYDDEALVGVLTGAGDRAFTSEILEELRALDERTHPDRRPDGPALTPGLARRGDA